MPAGLIVETPTQAVAFGGPAQFGVHTRTSSLNFAILAQYGGLSEPGTDICAAQIAGETLSLHTVVSCRAVWEADNGENRLAPRPLHNHPEGIALAEKCQTVVSIRCRSGSDDQAGSVCVDGLDTGRIAVLSQSISSYGFKAQDGAPNSRARHPDNICNRGVRMRGIELDISHQLMSRLLNSPHAMTRFTLSVRNGLLSILPDC